MSREDADPRFAVGVRCVVVRQARVHGGGSRSRVILELDGLGEMERFGVVVNVRGSWGGVDPEVGSARGFSDPEVYGVGTGDPRR